MNNSILEAKNVSKKYEGKTVLQDISLLAGKGEAIGRKKYAFADPFRSE